jgi:putative inorganic carbon (HCO3(-)) transporter
MTFLIAAVFLACLVLLASLSARSPAAAVALAAFFFPFENYYKLGVTITSNELLILALSSGLLVRLISGRMSFRWVMKVCVLFLPFCLSMCTSALVAASFPDAVKEVLRWLSFFAVLAAAAASIASVTDARRLSVWLVAASVPASVYGIFQSVLGLPSAAFELEPHSRIDSLFCLTTGWHVRAHSFFNQANSFACYLVIVLPLALFLAVRSRTRLKKLAAASAVALNLVALMLTFSRASWPLALLAIIVFFLMAGSRAGAANPHRRLRLAAPSLLVLLLALVGALFFRGADVAALVSGHSGVQRLNLYRAGLSMIAQKPFLGYGPGNYVQAATNVKMNQDEERIKRAHLHNLYLQVALETGIVGLCAFLFFVVSVIRIVCRGVGAARDGEPSILAASLCVSACAFFAYNMIDIYRYHGVHLVAAAIIGAGIAMTRLSRPREEAA